MRGLWLHLAAMAVLAALTMAACVRYAIHSLHGIALDNRMMGSLGHSAEAWVKLHDSLTIVTVTSVAICLVVCMAVAVSRGRVAVAAGAALLIAGANITTRVLKFHLLHRVDGRPNSLPSGHTTVSLSVGIAAVMVAPAAWRWVVVPAAGFVATFIADGTIVGHWHRPGDVLAGIAVCLGWAAVATAFVALLQRRRPPVPRPVSAARTWLALLGAAAVGIVFVGWGVRPQEGDVNLALAATSLIPIGLLMAAVIAWTDRVTERYLA